MKKFNLKTIKIDKTKTLILVGIITLLLFVGGATYAYFAFSSASPTQGNMEIISGTVDNLLFNIEKDIYINANLENFSEGMSDLSDDTDATATLIPNNGTNEATAMYNIYLIIESNDLEYTTDNQTPELLLNVTDTNGNKIENITGLVHYENGFDVTTRTGGFLIASDYVINASNIATVQTWNVEITLANLDSNQNANMNKTFSAKLYLTQDKMSSYNPVQVTNIEATPTYNSIDTSLNLSNGSADVDKYYFGMEETNNAQAYVNNNNGVVRLNNNILASADTVEYIECDTPNYEFTNLKENTEYTIYSYVVDVNGIKSNVYETQITTNEYDLPSVGNVIHSVTLNSITLTVNASGGDGTIVKYMYSKDNGNSWIESDSNTYTFNNLTDTTEYKIKVKVVDSNGRESTEYYEAISTETYILPVVANVDYETTYNSITLTPSGTDGTNVIDHYEYSINNGAYQTSNVFSGLNEQTEYTINVKAIDSAGRESNPYSIQVTTDTYQVPIISNVTTSSTTNSITINVSASNGDGTIAKYVYSRDNGSNWYESTSNSYTFDNLTSNTTFYVQVKAIDNNGRESAVSNATVTTQYINPVVNSVSASNVTTNSITLSVNATAGSNSIATYYYSSNNGSSYVSSGSNTYTFSGLSAGTTYNFRVYVVDSGNVKSNETTTSIATEDNSLAAYIKRQYVSDGINGLYYHDGVGNYENSYQEIGDSSYRFAGGDYMLTSKASEYDNVIELYDAPNGIVKFYCTEDNGTYERFCSGSFYSGDWYYYLDYDENKRRYRDNKSAMEQAINDGYLEYNIKNYICFGSDAETCPNNNLYRIIGVFGNEVKLIKNTSYGEYNWDSGNDNTWSPSRGIYPSIKSVLNENFFGDVEAIDSGRWSEKIVEHRWNIEKIETDHFLTGFHYNPIEYYNMERGLSDNMKIGLMYISDYGYAASPEYWNYDMSNYSEANYDNWLFSNLSEWTISGVLYVGNEDDVYDAMEISYGDVGRAGAISAVEDDIRPCFYLNSDVEYVSGSGTQSDPIRIN